MKKVILATLLITTTAFCKNGSEKSFIQEHFYHKHKIDFVNTTVFQQVDDYSSIYNTTHIFSYLDLTDKDQIFFNVSITFGNGLNKRFEREGYTVFPSGDDLEKYVRNVNETGRKYILELWYKKKTDNNVFVGGLIDSASFIDENKYANDEHTQFLNSAFINNPIAPIRSYNFGFYFKHTGKIFTYKSVYIKNSPETGKTGIFQINYRTEQLNIRSYYYHNFGNYENKGLGLSSDLSSGDYGFFVRAGYRFGINDHFFTAGMEKRNIFFEDKMAFASGYIDQNIKKYVYEIYYLYRINRYFSISVDIQHIKEKKSDFVYGLRFYGAY
ncbi:hypothetical protein [Persephonella sp.]